ncbi:MAG: PaaI family thioesterase [Firmicutes bacterium]|nr:PaaI family thioesterase [Bacillota bacterium]
MEYSANRMCFGCGPENPVGLHMVFEWEGDRLVGRFTPQFQHQSFRGVTHGGILSAMADEVMGKYLWLKGLKAVTAEMQMRFKKPVPVGQTLTIIGEKVEEKGRLFEMRAIVALPGGETAVEATGKFIKVGVVDE